MEILKKIDKLLFSGLWGIVYGRSVVKMNTTAFLSNSDGFSVFKFNDIVIRFVAPYSLEKYTSIKTWDNGYIVVMAKYSHNKTDEEEYIDLIPILKNLYIDVDKFLAPIKRVEIANE